MNRALQTGSLVLLLTSATAAQTSVELYKRINPSVVLIETDKGGGSGFCIDGKGLVATSLHVVDGANTASVSFRSGVTSSAVELIAADSFIDLAVLHVAESGCIGLVLGDSDALQAGQRVYVVGNPLARRDLTGSISDGLVSGIRTIEGKQSVLQISAPLSPGNSGGPVVSERGDVVGVVAFKLTTGELLNFAVPVNELKNLVQAERTGPPLHIWTASSGEQYRSSAYQLGAAALAVFQRAAGAMGTCGLEDTEAEELLTNANGRVSEQKHLTKRDYGELRIVTTKAPDGKPMIISQGSGLHGRWRKVNDKLTEVHDLVADDIVGHLADNWYAFCPGVTSLWRDVQISDEQVNGALTHRLLVKDPFYGSSIIFNFDASTGYLIRRSYTLKTASSPVTVVDVFSDFRKVGEFVVPFKESKANSGGRKAETIYKSFSANKGYPDYFFDP